MKFSQCNAHKNYTISIFLLMEKYSVLKKGKKFSNLVTLESNNLNIHCHPSIKSDSIHNSCDVYNSFRKTNKVSDRPTLKGRRHIISFGHCPNYLSPRFGQVVQLFLDVKNDVFALITKPSNNDYDVSDNCDNNFGIFDDFGAKNDQK